MNENDPEIPAHVRELGRFWRRFREARDEHRYRNLPYQSPAEMPERLRHFYEAIMSDYESGVYEVLNSVIMASYGFRHLVIEEFIKEFPHRRGQDAFQFALGERAALLKIMRGLFTKAMETYLVHGDA